MDQDEQDFWEKQKSKQARPKTAVATVSLDNNNTRKTRKEREENKTTTMVTSQQMTHQRTASNDSINQIIDDAITAPGVDQDDEYYEVEYRVSNYPSHKKKGYTFGSKNKESKQEDLPGPGNYEYKNRAVEGPEYSIYKKYPTKYESTPGPGDYEKPEDVRHGVTIGQRYTESKYEELPGPGNYESKSRISEGPQYSMYQRHEEKYEQTPGPGDYKEFKEKRGGVTIGQKVKERQAEDMPGPGNYEGKSTVGEGPQYSMYQKRDQKIEYTPGPGDYNEPEHQQKGVSIGQKMRVREAEDMPGPGNYEGKSTVGEGPQYSMYQKRDQKIEYTPGPGDYNELVHQQKGVTIGQKMKHREAEDMPGPGNYEGKSTVGEGPQYSMYQKRDNKIDRTPGPGDYNEPEHQQKGVSIGQKIRVREAEEMPGPGNYEGKSTVGEGLQYSMYQKRDQKIEYTPGPGDYNEPEHQQKGVTIGKRVTEKQIEEMPGPGNYEYKNRAVEGVQYSMYSKHDQKILQTPGPGDYNEPERQQKGVTIGQRVSERQVEDMPGPGNYEGKSTVGEGPQYSMYQKRDQRIEQTPGPGDYNEPGKQQKGVSIGQKFRNREQEEMPGPGNYEGQTTVGEGPQYSMYQKRDQKIEYTPGPGDYNEPGRQHKGVTIGQKIKQRDAEDMPGPGNYEGKSTVGEGPQYSMYQKRDQKYEQTPGPGDYNEPSREQKGVTIGGRHKDKNPEDLPGPGNYEYQNKAVEGPQYSMYQKRDQRIEQTPGPGDYNSPSKKQKGVTIGERTKDRLVEEMPGPGNYEGKSTVGEGPQYSMYQKRDQKIEYTPGPGDYNEPKNQQRGVTIGQKIRVREAEELPGPGNYEGKSTVGEGPQYSMYQKRDNRIDQTPGPGEYNEPSQQQKGITIGGKVKDRQVEDMPGPGNYEGKSHINDGPQYSMYQKREQRIEQTPGPGDYNEPGKKQKGVTIGGRMKERQVEDMPGPGNYEGKSTVGEGPQYSMYQKRDQKIEYTPGPGDYNEPSNQQKGVTIGQKIRQRDAEELPGPGNYEGKSTLGDGPHYSMYQKHDKNIEQTPGPGDYNEPGKKQKGVTIGQRIRQKDAEELPGPGNYEGKSTVGEGPQYSMYQRRDQKYEQTPGPGDYNEPSRQQKGITISGKVKDREIEDMPGPGNYEGKSTVGQGPQYSMYQKRDTKIQQTPGPGEYNSPTQKQKGVSIGQKMRVREAEDMPGPGNYEGKSHINEGPQYSMYQKRDQKIEQTPGPGDYNEPGNKQKGISMGQRMQNRQAEDMPGPGNYEGKSHINEGPQYSMYQKREQRIEQTPGPGDYSQPGIKQKGVTIGQKFTQRNPEELPGPGNYEGKSTFQEGPQYSMYQKRDQKIQQTPGPGDYNEPGKQQRGVTIGQRIKQRDAEELPGPGNYEGKSHIHEGPQYTISQKFFSKIEQTPGPGDYQVNEDMQISGEINGVKSQGKGVTIGKKFKNREAEELPGPGQYEDSPMKSSRGFKIGTKLSTRTEDRPGPGQYDADPLKVKYTQKTSALFSKSKAKRGQTIDLDDDEPGPGHYKYYNPKLTGKGVSFTKDRKDKFNNTYVPGPGSYGGLNDWAPGYGYER